MENPDPLKKRIKLDEDTDALFQAISEASDEDIDELVRMANVDPDMFAAFLKATGQEGTPAAKAIQEALTRWRPSAGSPPGP